MVEMFLSFHGKNDNNNNNYKLENFTKVCYDQNLLSCWFFINAEGLYKCVKISKSLAMNMYVCNKCIKLASLAINNVYNHQKSAIKIMYVCNNFVSPFWFFFCNRLHKDCVSVMYCDLISCYSDLARFS